MESEAHGPTRISPRPEGLDIQPGASAGLKDKAQCCTPGRAGIEPHTAAVRKKLRTIRIKNSRPSLLVTYCKKTESGFQPERSPVKSWVFPWPWFNRDERDARFVPAAWGSSLDLLSHNAQSCFSTPGLTIGWFTVVEIPCGSRPSLTVPQVSPWAGSV